MANNEEAPNRNDAPPILSYRTPEPRPPAEVLRTLADMPAPDAAMARAKLAPCSGAG